MGRPSKFDNTIADDICEKLSMGMSLVKICEAKGMVNIATVFRWLDKHEEFRDSYTHAREVQAEFYANQIIDIADESPIRESPDPDGGVTMCIDPAGVQRNKLRVDARKWVAARLLPKKYGERVEQVHSGTVTLEGLVCGDD